MREGELTYDDFLQRLNIQDVLIDAGYHLNRRDGLRYPSYVRLDSEGRRIRGDKFIVTQQGKCCFQAQQQRVYNIISFIKEHPHFFSEYRAGMSPDRLVNLVCNRLLNHPIEDRTTRIIQPKRDIRPFDIANYDLHKFNPQDRETQKKFYPYFKNRGIDLYTQYAFHRHFYLATKHRDYDAVLAMYHDQGLTPFKTLSPDGVNFTACLGSVRTSPDHGVAFDIAGQDKADPQSMRNAIYLATDIVNNRRAWAEWTSNPLPHAERERGGRDLSVKDLPDTEKES